MRVLKLISEEFSCKDCIKDRNSSEIGKNTGGR